MTKGGEVEIVPSTFLDTQSSLKLTTVYAVSEDSHRGVPVLLERLMNRRTHTYTHSHIPTEKDRQTGIKRERKVMFTCRRILIINQSIFILRLSKTW